MTSAATVGLSEIIQAHEINDRREVSTILGAKHTAARLDWIFRPVRSGFVIRTDRARTEDAGRHHIAITFVRAEGVHPVDFRAWAAQQAQNATLHRRAARRLCAAYAETLAGGGGWTVSTVHDHHSIPAVLATRHETVFDS